jgi:cytochrome bd-type quinol oxidase subunit 1
MVALGTTLAAFRIMANNSWMQAPASAFLNKREFAQ